MFDVGGIDPLEEGGAGECEESAEFAMVDVQTQLCEGCFREFWALSWEEDEDGDIPYDR